MPIDITRITPRVFAGGGIFTENNAREIKKLGVTHVVDMQGEFDDTPLFSGLGVEVLWSPSHDDFKAPEQDTIQAAGDFIKEAFRNPESVVFCHCAAGCHRGPMAALLALGISGMDLHKAAALIRSRRVIADFPTIYFKAVENYVKNSKVVKS